MDASGIRLPDVHHDTWDGLTGVNVDVLHFEDQIHPI